MAFGRRRGWLARRAGGRARAAWLAAGAVVVGSAACSLAFDRDRYEGGRAPDDGGQADAPGSDAACGDLLTDARNCGACGHDCVTTECAGGVCGAEVVVSGARQPTGLVVADGRVYWAEPDVLVMQTLDGVIRQRIAYPDAGGPQVPVVLSETALSLLLVLWGGADGSQIVQTLKGPLFAFAPYMTRVVRGDPSGALLVPRADERNVYASRLGPAAPGGQIVAAPLDGSRDASVVFARAGTQPLDVAVVGSADLVFSARTGVFVDAGPLSADAVLRVSADAGAGGVALASGEAMTGAVAVVGDKVYWARRDRGGVVRRVAIDGSGAEDFASSPDVDGPIAKDATRVYWLTRRAEDAGAGASVWACGVTRAPCAPLKIADLPAGSDVTGALAIGVALAAEGDWLYWTEPGHNVIKRVSMKMR